MLAYSGKGYFVIEPIDVSQLLREMVEWLEFSIEKIFDPFFTTKFTGRGLGMSAMMGIVRGHHGAIHIASSVGEGSTVRVLFPSLGRYVNDETIASSQASESHHLGGLVLVVDDDVAVMEMAVVMLEDLGFQTLCAVNGMEAVKQYRE